MGVDKRRAGGRYVIYRDPTPPASPYPRRAAIWRIPALVMPSCSRKIGRRTDNEKTCQTVGFDDVFCQGRLTTRADLVFAYDFRTDAFNDGIITWRRHGPRPFQHIDDDRGQGAVLSVPGATYSLSRDAI
jgi:hypothetical protein